MDFVTYNACEGTPVPVESVTGYPSTEIRTHPYVTGVSELATDQTSRA